MTDIERWWRIDSASYSEWTDDLREARSAQVDGAPVTGPFVLGAVDPAEIVAWLRGRTGAYGGGFTSADDVADAIKRKFVDRRPGGG